MLTYEYRLDNPRCCTARRQDGKPCGRWAIRGGNVCRVHGGAAPQVLARARERLTLAADAMARNLLGLADTADSESVRLAATNSALDRTGLGAKQSVDVDVKLQPWEELLRDVVYEHGVSREEHNARRGLQMPVIDAEVVDMGASGHVREREREERPDTPPPTRQSRTRQLGSAEEAVAETTSANRRSTRRKRR